jgi:G3E family GTPase
MVLEASGVAEPSGIAVTFLDARLRDRIRLDSIMCLVDASQVFAVPELMELKLRQIAFADMLILNKADLVSHDQITAIKAWLNEHFHRYRLVEATRGEVPLEILVSAGRFDAARLDSLGHAKDALHDCNEPHCNHRHKDDHTRTFSTWSYETSQPLSLDALREAARKLPANIYRCKGVIHSADEPSRRAVLQVVGKRVDISLENGWGQRAPHTHIVAIGAHGTIDDEELREKFDRCLAETPTATTK